MNQDALNKLFAMLPKGTRKQELMAKYTKLQTKSQKRGGDGLNDTFEFKPTGHIKIEAIDESGDVVGVLADQPNLVVDGAEEILLRAFSGDPNRILYKNRLPKAASGVTGKIYIPESKLNNEVLIKDGQLLHAPNILWTEVNDEDFEVSYGYFPVTLYVKEEQSLEPGKKAFSLSKTAAADRVPLTSEIYSTFTNMFIGIGEGKHYSVDLMDARLTVSEGASRTSSRIETATEGESLEFTVKMSNFKLDVEKSSEGAQIDVFINGVLKETIDSLDSNLEAPEVVSFEYDQLDTETETAVKIVHSGGDEGVVSPKMAIAGLHFDALHKGMNGLIKEFKNYETDFLTPAAFNTTPMAPFTIQLPNFPVKEGSVKINYEGIEFTEATEELTDTSFKVDYLRGVVTFNRALTGLMATYSSTGEIYDSELVASMTAGSGSAPIVTPTPVTNASASGAVDGVNKNFTLSHSDVDSSTLVVKVDGSVVAVESFTPSARSFTLVTAPTSGQVVSADYTRNVSSTVNRSFNSYKLAFAAKAEEVELFDQDGTKLQKVAGLVDLVDGTFFVDPLDAKVIKMSQKKADGSFITRVEVKYKSDERPGVPTQYTRAVIEKPKTVNEYPWFELDKGSVKFVAEFPEMKPAHNITIREMGLFDGPRSDDKIAGFRNYPVKAFSLVRVGETRKEVNTGIRITWTITLLNADGQSFQGGR